MLKPIQQALAVMVKKSMNDGGRRMTNLEYVRSLCAKELADLLVGKEDGVCEVCANHKRICVGKCQDGIVEWLLSEREEELKPCPFCGGEAQICETANNWSFVACNECSAEVRGDTKDEAIEKWNRREKDE